MRRIKIMPAVKNEKNKITCSLCEKEPCQECCYGFKEDDILLYAPNNYRLNCQHNVTVKKTKLTRILKNAEESVNDFLESKKNSAVVWCTSNAFDYSILGSGIAGLLSAGRNVLFVTAESFTYEARQKLNDNFEGAIIDITDGFEPDYSKLDIAICSYNSFPCYHKAFDIVVMDLRYLFLDIPAQNIYYRSYKTMKEKGKILYLTSNLNNLKNKFAVGRPEIIPIPLTPSLKPVPEPRIVTSRFLGSNEWFLPPMVTEMIHWSINSGNGVIIFVPDENLMLRLYNYLADSEELNFCQIGISSVNDKAQLLSLRRGDINILISSDIRDTLQSINNINVVVLYGGDKAYHIDALINMSSMAAWHTGHSQGEVVFVANQEDESMSLAKNAIRSINKVAWEKGYLSR
jgi:late competence protein required for DNA uptake (superfamily II DNA/RNA helicase)